MCPENIKLLFKNRLKFNDQQLNKLFQYEKILVESNQKYNFIGESTVPFIWKRHFLDSAQIIKFIEFQDGKSVADLGSGAGFPGILLALYNRNPKFHVKLYEKSKVKAIFLRKLISELNIDCSVYDDDITKQKIEADFVVARAFKKLPEIMHISREIIKKDHKLIILSGKSAQEQAEKASKEHFFKYKLEDSITDKESKIIVVDVIKKWEKI